LRRQDARKIKKLEAEVAQLRRDLDERQRRSTKQMHAVTELRAAVVDERRGRKLAEKQRDIAHKDNAAMTQEAEYWMRSYHELVARNKAEAERRKLKDAATREEQQRLHREVRDAWHAKSRVDKELRGWHWFYAKLEPHDKKWVREYRKTMPAGFDYDAPQ
jgi:hypothetical protein